MSFSDLSQELKDVIVNFSDIDSCPSISLVCRSLRVPAQKKIFEETVFESADSLDQFFELAKQSGGQLLESVTGDLEICGFTLSLQTLLAFPRARSIHMFKARCFLLPPPSPISSGLFLCLSSLSLSNTNFPLGAIYYARSLENLELVAVRLSGSDIDHPLPDRRQLRTLLVEQCTDPRIHMLLSRLVDCSSLRVLKASTKEKVHATSENGLHDQKYLYRMMIDASRDSLEDVTLEVLQSTVLGFDSFYDWTSVPNLKDFTLIFGEEPRNIGKLDRFVTDPNMVTRAILSNLSLIRKDQIQNIRLHLTDYYEHPTFAMPLPSRCTSAPGLWKSIGETLVAMAQSRRTQLKLTIEMHAVIDTIVETDGWDVDPSIFKGETIEDWFAKHVVTSPSDREQINLVASMTSSDVYDHLEEYYSFE